MSAVVAFIPARLGSARLARKPLQDLGGKTLIVRVCEAVAKTELFERIVVATDHDDIATVVRQAGFTAVLTDPQLPSGTDRIAAAAAQIKLDADARIVNVQGDEPFVDATLLRDVLSSLGMHPEAVVTPVEVLKELSELRDPNVVKAVLGGGGRALYFSRAAVPYDRDSANTQPSEVHFRHVGVYAYTHTTLRRITQLPAHPLETCERLEQLRWLAYGQEVRCVEVAAGRRGIDTEEDLQRARAYFADSAKA